MFWGVTILPGRRYSQTVEISYHISKACLEVDLKNSERKRVQLMLEHNKTKYLLCTLDSESILQTDLDLIFRVGEEVTFYIVGEGTIHLTGYILDFSEDEDDLDDSDIDAEDLMSFKRKLNDAAADGKIKKTKTNSEGIDEEDEDEEDDDDLGDLDVDEDIDEEDSEFDEEDDDEDEEDEEEDDDEEKTIKSVKPPMKKQEQSKVNGHGAKGDNKATPKTPNQNQNSQQKQNQNQQQKPKFGGGQQSPNNKFGGNQKGGQNFGGKFNNQNKNAGGAGQGNKQNNFNKAKGPFTPGNKVNNNNKWNNKNKKARASMS